jgi:VWFA-related protein
MRARMILLVCAITWFGCLCASAQQAEATSTSSTPTFHAETKLVLVDAIVTDKSGHHVTDLEQKDFKIWEDGKEQTISSFSLERSQIKPSTGRQQYMVLFFDNSNMQTFDQAKARDAAEKFIDANSGSGRMIAVVDFGGTLRVAQNFTSDAARLKQAVKTFQYSAVSGNVQTDSAPSAALTQLQADFGTHTVLLALSRVAKALAMVPGRKSLVLLSSGFPLTPEVSAEVSSVIAICNHANVAIYPIDARGLTVPGLPLSGSLQPESNDSAHLALAEFRYNGRPRLQLASFLQPLPNVFAQKGGTGGTTGGGHPPATTGGGHPGSPTHYGSSAMPDYGMVGPRGPVQPRIIVPEVRHDASDNQQVMWQLAEATGGFPIINSTDFASALQRIADDQSEYYLLGYKPPSSEDGQCHTIKVKVERSGVTVRARSGYCNLKPQDALAGTPVEQQMEKQAAAASTADVKAAVTAPYFYTSANIARVDLSADIPPTLLKFEKEKGKQHSTLSILGIAYKPDGSVAARFSDSSDLNFDEKKKMEQFLKEPYHYETQFELASGQYKLTLVFGSGEQNFGRVEMPLSIDPYEDKQFAISGVALSNDIRKVSGDALELEGALMEDKTPLLYQGLEFMPSASKRFKSTEEVGLYTEIYEPLLKDPNPPEVAYELIVHDRKTNAEKYHIGQKVADLKPGNPVIPVGVRLPVDKFGPGEYRAEVTAVDSAGNSSATRVVDFEVQ